MEFQEEIKQKKGKEKIIMLTAYDYQTAKILDETNIDLILVGDSLGMVVQGHSDTKKVTMRDMIYHTKTVARGAKSTPIIGDMPINSYNNTKDSIRNAELFLDAGAHGVKIEGNQPQIIQALIEEEIPVMGHVGMLPQKAKKYRLKGKEPSEAEKIYKDSTYLDNHGVFSIVVECVPEALAAKITSEVNKVFDFFAHTYKNYTYRHLIASPLYLRKKMYSLIDQEIKNAKAGKEAYIILKLNSLVDKEIIYRLYRANNAGVKITLIIRGICSLIPGIKGMSENIKAISIVDKYLEHSRIFIFSNNGNEKIYISSADWMVRNLDYRIEVACPVFDREIQRELKQMINIQWRDNVKARIINQYQNNTYRRNNSEPNTRAQIKYYQYLKQRHKH